MIACLRGELFYKGSESLIVDVNGVGYEVFFPQTGHDRLPDLGDEVFLHIQSIVREDAFQLYGFLSPEEKKMFLVLTAVSGIGPKLAAGILANCSPKDLARAISSDDVGRLVQLPGIGKKTAERLCLELKDKVDFVPAGLDSSVPTAQSGGGDDNLLADALSALTNLGYPPARARVALETIRKDLGDEAYRAMPIEELLRQVLRSLA